MLCCRMTPGMLVQIAYPSGQYGPRIWTFLSRCAASICYVARWHRECSCNFASIGQNGPRIWALLSRSAASIWYVAGWHRECSWKSVYQSGQNEVLSPWIWTVASHIHIVLHTYAKSTLQPINLYQQWLSVSSVLRRTTLDPPVERLKTRPES